MRSVERSQWPKTWAMKSVHNLSQGKHAVETSHEFTMAKHGWRESMNVMQGALCLCYSVLCGSLMQQLAINKCIILFIYASTIQDVSEAHALCNILDHESAETHVCMQVDRSSHG